MCGICGIYYYSTAAQSNIQKGKSELIRIRDYMHARGPDAAGEWYSGDESVLFGHRRLSIIDLSSHSDQPMSDGGGLTIVFNGEIYNYRELREGLIAKGHNFKTQGDTEVLLSLYREHGSAMLDKLRGMFAFAIYNESDGSLFAARDPFGIKPFYYRDDGKVLKFASSVKALAESDGALTPNDAAIAGVLSFGSVPEPLTIYEEIKALGAGENLYVAKGQQLKISTWYNPARYLGHPPHKLGALSDTEVSEALKDSLRYHMVADTEVGLFLSAGLDSTTMLALLSDIGFNKIHTITAKFTEYEGAEDDESVLAAKAAEFYGANHTEYLITRAEFEEDFDAFLNAMDQPTIDGLNTWFVSKAAQKAGLKVCLSGLGADELFGGYPSFHNIPRWSHLGILGPSKIREPLIDMLAGLCQKAGIDIHPKAAGLLGLCDGVEGAYQLKRGLFMPWEVSQIMGRERGRAALKTLAAKTIIGKTLDPMPSSDFGRVIILETALYMRNQLLRDSDWSSMAHSLELRVPFVDKVLFETLAPRLAAHHTPGKLVLTRAPKGGLMSELVNRPKTGFTVPLGSWTDSRLGDLEGKFAKAVIKGHWSRRWALEVVRRVAFKW